MIEVALEIAAIVALSGTVSAIVSLALFPWALRHFDPTVTTLEIRSKHMSSVVEGGTLAFTVVAKNKAGVVVHDTGITVKADAGSATVADDGSSGVFTAGTPGVANLVATDGKVTSAPFAVTVSQDLAPHTLEIVAA